jgi:hypothetical protein
MTSAEQQLRQLEQCAGIDRRRLALARTLLQRAGSERPRVSVYLHAQAAQVLAACAADAQQLQLRAQAALSLLREQFPAALAQAEQLLQRGDLVALAQLPARLQRRARAAQACVQLRELTRQLVSIEMAPLIAPSGLAFDDLLQCQEQEILQALRPEAVAAAAVPSEPAVGTAALAVNAAPALKSARVFRQTRVEQDTDFRLDTAIRTGPESPGPLNPQMLTIRALTTLRDLSPQYLSRFMAYAETLLWLDQADTLPDPVKPGKPAKTGANKAGARNTAGNKTGAKKPPASRRAAARATSATPPES